MGGKAAVFLGLVAGLVVGGAAVGAVIALAPVPAASPVQAAPSAAAPSAAAESFVPGGSAVVASGAPSGSGGVAPGSSAGSSPGAPAGASPGATSPAEAFGIGQPAPALKLPTVGGETVNLEDFRGKPVWVNFMASWCPSCRDELPLMQGFLARYEKTGLVVVEVDVKEDEATAQAFFQDLGVYLPVALDADGAAQSAWGALALPVHFWVDKDGIVRHGALGGIGAGAMAEGLQTILPGVKVTP